MKIFGYEIRKVMTREEYVKDLMMYINIHFCKLAHEDLRALKRALAEYDTKKKQWKIKGENNHGIVG